ncbi:hypothetical protein ACFV1C_08425, partial [Streptomyces sp. NPDC059605]
MVTFAQAQERADEWINGDVPAYQHREVRVREFELGFVVWAEDRAEGPVSDGGRQRMVIARDSGEATLWPGLPVGEVIRRYEEEYGGSDAAATAAPEPPQRIDLNQTSFLLSPPEWLQEAADKLGIPDSREGRGQNESSSAPSAPPAAPTPSASSTPPPFAAPSAPAVPAASPGSGDQGAPGGRVPYEPTANEGVPASAPNVPDGATPWAGTDTNAGSDDGAVPLPATVFAPPLSGADDENTPPPVIPADAPTALMSGGSQLPPTALVPGLDRQGMATPPPGVPAAPGAPGVPGVPPGAPAPGAGDIADAATSKAAVSPRGPRGGGPSAPPPPGAPGAPGARPGAPVPPPSGPGAPGAPAGGYMPTQLAPQTGGPGAPQPPGPPGPPGAPGAPGAPQPPGPPGPPGAPGAP